MWTTILKYVFVGGVAGGVGATLVVGAVVKGVGAVAEGAFDAGRDVVERIRDSRAAKAAEAEKYDAAEPDPTDLNYNDEPDPEPDDRT